MKPRGEIVPGAALAAAVWTVLLSGDAAVHPSIVPSAAAAPAPR